MKAGTIMKFKKAEMWKSMNVATLGALGCGLFLGGCARQEKVYVQQPQTSAEQQAPPVEQQTQYADQQPQSVIVQDAPPPLIVEAQPPPPSAASVWVGGYWNWDSQKYNWQAGRYVTPPQRDVVWVAPRYDKDAHGTRYTPGQWTKQTPSKDSGPGRDSDTARPKQ
jgi:WXXGXW repeat (2 copies)